jgi:hypothetical protein
MMNYWEAYGNIRGRKEKGERKEEGISISLEPRVVYLFV